MAVGVLLGPRVQSLVASALCPRGGYAVLLQRAAHQVAHELVTHGLGVVHDDHGHFEHVDALQLAGVDVKEEVHLRVSDDKGAVLQLATDHRDTEAAAVLDVFLHVLLTQEPLRLHVDDVAVVGQAHLKTNTRKW